MNELWKMYLIIIPFLLIGTHGNDLYSNDSHDVRIFNAGIVLTRNSRTLLHTQNLNFPLKLTFQLPTITNSLPSNCNFDQKHKERLENYVDTIKKEILRTIHFFFDKQLTNNGNTISSIDLEAFVNKLLSQTKSKINGRHTANHRLAQNNIMLRAQNLTNHSRVIHRGDNQHQKRGRSLVRKTGKTTLYYQVGPPRRVSTTTRTPNITTTISTTTQSTRLTTPTRTTITRTTTTRTTTTRETTTTTTTTRTRTMADDDESSQSSSMSDNERRLMRTLKEMNERNGRRKRRSFQYLADGYLTLSGWSEQKFSDERRWSKNHFADSNKRITSMGIAINKTADSLERISLILCEQNQEFELELLLLETKLEILQQLKYISMQITQADMGILPNSVPNAFLNDFCRKHFKSSQESKFCSIVNVRELFKTKPESVYITKDFESIKFVMRIEVPETAVLKHAIYKIDKLPVHDQVGYQTRTYILNLDVSYVGVLLPEEESQGERVVGFVDCLDDGNYVSCNKRIDPIQSKCLDSIINGQSYDFHKYCTGKTRVSDVSCYYMNTALGTFVSSSETIDIHRTRLGDNKLNIFRQGTESKSGLFFVPKSPEFLKLLNCNGKLIRTVVDKSLDKELNIQVEPIFQGNISFDVIDEDFQLKSDIQQVRENLGNSLRQNDIKTRSHDKELTKISKQLNWMSWTDIILFIVCGIVGLIVLAIITYFIQLIFNNIRKCRATREIKLDS